MHKPNEAFFHSESDLQLCSCLAESILKLQGLKQFEEMRKKHTHTKLIFGCIASASGTGSVMSILTQAKFPRWSHVGFLRGTETAAVVAPSLISLLLHYSAEF